MIDRSSDPYVRWALETGRVAQGTLTRVSAGIVTYSSYAPVSDGIVEAHAPSGELWGFDRLEAALRSHNPALRPDDLIAKIIEQVTQWMDGAEQHDDMTIVVIQPSFAPSVTPHSALLVEELTA